MKIIKTALSHLSKALLVLSVIFVVITFFANYIIGDAEIKIDPDKSYKKQVYQIINDKELNSTEQGRTQVMIYRQVMCTLMGEGCTNNPADAEKNYEKSMVSGIINGISLPFAKPPASGQLWVQEGLANAGFVPSVYAQGIGFYGLQPLAPLWKAFRNISYMILVLGMVLIGFLIMFRYKVDPQTTISVESALPRFAYTLLTITFSFAISGFLIDLMYIFMGLSVSTVIESVKGSYPGFQLNELQSVAQHLYSSGPSRLFDLVTWNGNVWNVGHALISMLPFAVKGMLEGIIGMAVGYVLIKIADGSKLLLVGGAVPFIGGLLSLLLAIVIGFAGFGIGITFAGIILSLVAWCTLLVLFFRILIKVFFTYTNIILWIIFAPVYLLQDIIPGKSAFTDWLKNLVGELLTYPLIIVLIMISALIAQTDTVSTSTYNLWQPPFATNRSVNGFATLIAMVLLVNIPKIVDQVKEALGVKGGPGYGVGSLFGGAIGGVGGAFSMYRGMHTFFKPNESLAKSGLGKRFLGAFKNVLPGKAAKAIDNLTGDTT